MNLIHKLRCAIDESYRIEIGYGLSLIRNNRELRALIKFCKKTDAEYIKEGVSGSFLPIWRKTVKLYDKYEATGKGYRELIYYIEKHCREYWS